MLLYRVARDLIVAICRVYWRVRIEGKEHVPAKGPFVLAPVHRSFIDFGLAGAVTRRRMRFMTKEEMFESKILGRLLSALGAFPVHRGGADREALRRSIEVIKGGEPLVIFPEGTRRSGPVVSDLFEGAAYVALRTGVPIVPVGIGGSERALRKGETLPRPVRVHVIVGEPIRVDGTGTGDSRRPSRRAVHELTQRLQAEVQRLFDEAQRKAGVRASADGRTST
jgi:1-acyl-sn-glycerol-3-phosphate acyltransferase